MSITAGNTPTGPAFPCGDGGHLDPAPPSSLPYRLVSDDDISQSAHLSQRVAEPISGVKEADCPFADHQFHLLFLAQGSLLPKSGQDGDIYLPYDNLHGILIKNWAGPNWSRRGFIDELIMAKIDKTLKFLIWVVIVIIYVLLKSSQRNLPAQFLIPKFKKGSRIVIQTLNLDIGESNASLQWSQRRIVPVCYESDPLEEREKDYVRSQEYKYCMNRLSLGESLDGVRGSFD
ncbi:hypothetical protein L2E82_32332 [Cichorium intybus]|uniref:Uncharacterized protein n=1 Tax=Cichorium intybus TaxID=13427 RepID=A0ACB9BI90_CICIN|nr:hypothetical protein L2E82_32332 [Cichorium intybus]